MQRLFGGAIVVVQYDRYIPKYKNQKIVFEYSTVYYNMFQYIIRYCKFPGYSVHHVVRRGDYPLHVLVQVGDRAAPGMHMSRCALWTWIALPWQVA